MNKELKATKIGFIGAGNMASSLIRGLLESGLAAKQIWVSDPNRASYKALAEPGLNLCETNTEVASEVDVLLFAVKPQVFSQPAREIAAILQKRTPLVISIAAGVSSKAMVSWLGEGLSIVRTMPNTPALIGQGITALYASSGVSEKERVLAGALMQAVGDILWVEKESLIDAATAVSGSGPAYVFRFIEAMMAAAEEIGLSPEAANQLVLKTFEGAVHLALKSQDQVSTLREKVTSPGGTTEAALNILQQEGFELALKKAIRAAMHRAEELSQDSSVQ